MMIIPSVHIWTGKTVHDLRLRTMTNANQAPLPRLSKRRWYVLRLLSGAISSTWLYLYLYEFFLTLVIPGRFGDKVMPWCLAPGNALTTRVYLKPSVLVA